MARALVLAGDQHFEAREFELALERYREAFVLVPVPTVGIEVMKAQTSLGLFLEARATALSVAGSAVLEAEPAVFAEARSKALELVEILDRITPELRISIPPEAELDVDGQPIGQGGAAPLSVRLNPGRHILRLRVPGREAVEQSVELRVAEQRQEVLELPPLPARHESESAPLGEPAPISESAPLGEPAAFAERSPADAADEKSWSTGAWIALGVAAAGVAVGTPAGLLALSEADKARGYCDEDSCERAADEHIQSSEALGNAATVSFAVAGAAALYFSWELLFASEPGAFSASSRAEMTPLFSIERSRVELGLSGAF